MITLPIMPMITAPMIPMIIVPTTFLFVLLIILIAKAPKAGAWIVGGLVFLLPVVLYRAAMAGALTRPEAIPLFVVPLTFLFVLLVVLLGKAPKAGVGLIVAILVMVVLSLVLWPLAARMRAAQPTGDRMAVTQIWPGEQEQTSVSVATIESVPTKPEAPTSVLTPPEPPVSPLIPSEPPAPVVPSPIWAPGIEQELAADLYPSKPAAVRALGSRVDKSMRTLNVDVNSPPQITIFQEENDRALIVELKNAIQRSVSDAPCAVEAELRNIQPKETGITVRLADVDTQSAPWAQSPEVKVASGKIEMNVFTTGGQVAAGNRFVEKPWVESFATFASTRPGQQFIVARSLGTCMSEGEAHQQALNDARARLAEAIGKTAVHKRAGWPQREVTTTDVLRGGFVIDQFTQSLEGSAGRIWRQAMLIDVSGAKLAQLFSQKTHESRQMRVTWARMGFSAIGVIVLIGAIYFFLNMATRGYYEWSLRIAGIVLAIVAVVSVLMVVR